ncbi:hypothetical protein PV10_03911 [Exophiala mesophila]|uniref:Transcription factor domain-containing protein n=1 Tax=Exophiala mesophila TaxID=212818 RepID=A0A0D2A0P1_EXOME|nr:uncharacterized protein PV10_03911 [Exophiala mesophila]KIV92638.1 hypothetical protein PV10_03911 [Exophiala mesophila]
MPPDTRPATLASPLLRHPIKTRNPEPELVVYLIEIYFSHCFTASLLFDYSTLSRDYRAHKVPDYVVLSICAFGSLFARKGASFLFQRSVLLGDSESICQQGKAWADQASQAVLIRADKPSIAKIRACEILAIYWFAVGELDRSAIHASISRESCRVLMHKSKIFKAQKKTAQLEQPQVSEDLHRICCAIWIKACIMDGAINDNQEISDLAPAPPVPSDSEIATWPELVDLSPSATDWMSWGHGNMSMQNSTFLTLKLFGICLSETCGSSVIRYANSFADLARDFLATSPDLGKVPTFVGYCAFVAGSVHAHMMHADFKRENSVAHANGVVCLIFLTEMKIYYPVLQDMWEELKTLLHGEAMSSSDVQQAAVKELMRGSPASSDFEADPSPGILCSDTTECPSCIKNKSNPLIFRTFFDSGRSSSAFQDVGGDSEEEEMAQDSHVQAPENQNSGGNTPHVPFYTEIDVGSTPLAADSDLSLTHHRHESVEQGLETTRDDVFGSLPILPVPLGDDLFSVDEEGMNLTESIMFPTTLGRDWDHGLDLSAFSWT